MGNRNVGVYEKVFKKIFEKFLLLVFLFAVCADRVGAREIRPNVDETTVWKKCEISNVTENWNDNRKIIWCYIGKGGGDQKKYIGALVICADNAGNAEIWADAYGLHFFDEAKNEIKTPFDFSRFNFIGPNMDYQFNSDPSLSYFYVQWASLKPIIEKNGKEKGGINTGLNSGTVYTAFLDKRGDVLWRTTVSIPPYDNLIDDVCISTNGDLIVAEDDDGEDGLYSLEIWDKNGKKTSKLPGIADKFSWSSDGKSVQCEWYDLPTKGLNGSDKLKNTVYDRNGNWISGDR